MQVAIVGCGYVGLVSGACFAEFGAQVSCLDQDAARVRALRAGHLPIYEPGLAELVNRQMQGGRLTFDTSLRGSVPDADLVFIAVGTPGRRESGETDLASVYATAREIAGLLKGYTVIVNKSTVPVGTAQAVQRLIREDCPDAEFDVASNPEFLREGSAVGDFLCPDRVIIGTHSDRARGLLTALYRPLSLQNVPLLCTDWQSAELSKYAANAFLATKLSFINEMANLCERVGADIRDVARGMGLDHRIGREFLHPGPGFGGSCLPKDTRALLHTAEQQGEPGHLLRALLRVNEEQKARMTKKILAAFGGTLSGKHIALLGLAFKAGTDDMRESLALSLVPALLREGASIRASDPKGADRARPLLPDTVQYCACPYEAMSDADAVVLLTEWNEFQGMELARIRRVMRGDKFFDLRNIYEPEEMRALGFDYHCVGRGHLASRKSRQAGPPTSGPRPP